MAAVHACLALALTLVSLSAGDQISCYQCNSGAGFSGAPCLGKNGATELQKFYLPCPTDSNNYTRCRVMYQTVEGDARTIRMCATEGTGGPDNCITRIGVARVTATYCQCHPKTPAPGAQAVGCNRAAQPMTSYALAVTSLVVAAWAWLGLCGAV